MTRVRGIHINEWEERKLEDRFHDIVLKKDYVGDVSVLEQVCGDARSRPKAKPGRNCAAHRENYDSIKLRPPRRFTRGRKTAL